MTRPLTVRASASASVSVKGTAMANSPSLALTRTARLPAESGGAVPVKRPLAA